MDATNAIIDRNSVSVTYLDDTQAVATAKTREALLSWFRALERDGAGFNSKLIIIKGGLEDNSSLILSVKPQYWRTGLKIQSVLENAGIICKNLPPLDEEFISHLVKNGDAVYNIGGRSYKIQYLLSDRGAFGDVFMAIDQESKQVVAIKILRDNNDYEPYQLQMLQRKGPHPNVVQFISYGLILGRNCIVMEYISGQTLGQYQSNSKWTEELQQQYDSAIHFIRRAGIITERENESENVLITSIDGKPTVKLIDFGTLARK